MKRIYDESLAAVHIYTHARGARGSSELNKIIENNKIRYDKKIYWVNKTSEKRNNIGCINSNNNSSCNLSNGNNKVIV